MAFLKRDCTLAVVGAWELLAPVNDQEAAFHRKSVAASLIDKTYEFMFVLGKNKYQGAVQSMVNPVAIR